MILPSLPSDWAGRFVTSARALAIGKCEDKPNRGQVPDYCSRTNGGALADFWCCHFVCTVGVRALRNAWPLLTSGSCEQQRQRAQAHRALRTRAEFDALRAHAPLSVLGWVGLSIGPDDAGRPHAHHAFVIGDVNEDALFVTQGTRGGFVVIEGNAADPKGAASRNGDGAYAGRERGHVADSTVYEFIDLAALAVSIRTTIPLTTPGTTAVRLPAMTITAPRTLLTLPISR